MSSLRGNAVSRDRALIEPTLLRNGAFTSGLLVVICFFAAMIGLNLVLWMFCQLGEGFSPLRTGLALAPFALGIAALATIFFAYLDDRSTPVTALTGTALLSLIPLGLTFLAVFRLAPRAREEAAGA